jgi:hypothetical protein
MISYNDLDFAIARWKARVGGAPQPAQAPVSGTVEAEVPVATAPDAGDAESGAVAEEAQPTISSGLVVTEGLFDPAQGQDAEQPDSEQPDSEQPDPDLDQK